MATMEALRTRLDTLQWEVNQLEVENRRLREEHPEESRVLTLEAELERSKNEAATLRDRVGECEREIESMSAETTAANEDQSELAGRPEAERRTSDELREALARSEGRESELTEALEREEAELERLRADEERREEARELRYYRALETEREKWEAREKRVLDEVDRLRGDREGTKSVDYIAMSEQLGEAHRQQQRLREAVSEGESLVCSLKGRLEECLTENEELRAELDLLRIKVRRLERSTSTVEGSEKDDPGATTQPSSRLDARAPAFRPAVRSSLPGEATPQTSRTTVETVPSTGATGLDSGSTAAENVMTAMTPSCPGSGATLPSDGAETTSVTSTSTTVMATLTSTSMTPTHPGSTSTAAASGDHPATSGTGVHSSGLVQRGVSFVVGATSTLPSATLAVSQTVPVTSILAPSVVTTPMETTGTASSYLVVHPHHLPQIPNFHWGDQRDGETFEDWFDHFEAVASIARWDQNFKLVHLTAALRGNAKSFYRSCTSTQRSSYPQLVSALKKRFIPVKLTALQTQMFHSQKQGATESVDDFAQELRKLHSKAYSTAMNGNPEAEKVGHIVLVNQFVSGLRSELQAKAVGVEGSMDELVAKARFEEAKSKELSGRSPGLQPKKTYPSKGQSGGHTNRPSLTTPAATSSTQPTSVDQGEMTKERRGKKPVTCFQCGIEGHIRSSCPYPRPQKEGAESRGRPQIKNMTSRESPGSPMTGQQKEIQELRGRLRQAELAEAINSAGA